jgi:hypothetical protein
MHQAADRRTSILLPPTVIRTRNMRPAAPTLPDLLRDGLEVVFVGINPSVFSATRGHYFARPTNRFWHAFSRSALSRKARQAMGVIVLTPEHDRALLEHGFGFTDLVKRPTARAAEIAPDELASGRRSRGKARAPPAAHRLFSRDHGISRRSPVHHARQVGSESRTAGDTHRSDAAFRRAQSERSERPCDRRGADTMVRSAGGVRGRW